MGDSCDNIYLISHKMRGTGPGTNDYKIRRHLGNANIDIASPGFDHDAWKAMRGAALNGNDAAFDAAGEAACGSTWWQTHISGIAGNRATLRMNIIDLCAQ